MEFSLREWLIVIGVIIIIAILIDGYRRYKKSSSLSIANDDEFVDPEILMKEAVIKRELPNGGARPVSSTNAVQNAFEAARKTPKAPLTDLPHKVDAGPVLDRDDQLHLDELESLVPERLTAGDRQDVKRQYADNEDQQDFYEANAHHESLDYAQSYSDFDYDDAASHGTVSQYEDAPSVSEIEEVIVINVFASEEQAFLGQDLLQLVLNCGMRYGEMDIFHRHEDGFDKGKVQFSMANAVEPGTFDLDTLSETLSPGVSFFMGLPGPKNSMKAFDFMLETAQTLVRNLGGELRDERRNRMSDQTIAHCRQRIRDFERRRMTRASS